MSSNNTKTYKKLYQVESIVDMEYDPDRKQYMYQVKWKGYPSSQNTWEPVEHLDNVIGLVEEFKQKKKKKEQKAKKSRSKLDINVEQQDEVVLEQQLETPQLNQISKEDKNVSVLKVKQFDYKIIYDKLEKAFNDFVKKYQKLNAKKCAEKKQLADQSKVQVAQSQDGKISLPLSYFPWQGEASQLMSWQKNIDY